MVLVWVSVCVEGGGVSVETLIIFFFKEQVKN